MDQPGPRTQQRDCLGASYPASARRQDGRSGGCELSRELMLKLAESRLAVCTNNSWDRSPGPPLDLGVKIQEREAQPLGEQPADGALPRAREADQD